MENEHIITFFSQDQLFLYHKSNAIFDVPQYAIKPHSHPHYEIMQLIEGDLECVVEGKLYHVESGDVLFISANNYHTIKSNATVYKRRVVEFEEKYLQVSPACTQKLLTPYKTKGESLNTLVPRSIVKALNLDAMFDKIEKAISMPNDSEIYIPIHILSLLIEINSIVLSETRIITQSKNDHYVNSIITDLINYIDKNIEQKITLGDLEKQVNLSKYYISHLFKKSMGISIGNYIIVKKIRYAEQLIRQGTPPTQASLIIGYNNYSNFYENYLKITKSKPKDTTIMIHTKIE